MFVRPICSIRRLKYNILQRTCVTMDQSWSSHIIHMHILQYLWSHDQAPWHCWSFMYVIV